jgi:hypothetical protein
MVSHQAPFPETILAQQHAPFVFTLASSPTHHAAFFFFFFFFFLSCCCCPSQS